MTLGLRSARNWLRNATRPLRRGLAIKQRASELTLALHRLRGQAKRRRFKGPVIAITGSSGKSTTASLVDHLLSSRGQVASRIFRNTLPDISLALSRLPNEARFAVFETGITKIGSMRPMAELIRPTVAIVTKIAMEHYSAFRTKEVIATEKGALIEALPADGLAILNFDDPLVMAMAGRTAGRVVTFGTQAGADYRATNLHAGLPGRLTMQIECKAGTLDVSTPFLDEAFWLATTAAFACAVELGVDAHNAARLISTFAPPWNRLGLVEIAGGPTFIADTAKAPNESIAPTLQVIERAKARRKTVVLGQISDYAGNPRKHYKEAYRLARKAADRVIFVGDAHHRANPTEEDIESGLFSGFATAQEAYAFLRAHTEPGELVLIKGSARQHLERLILAWTNDVKCWEMNCGKSIDCIACGMMHIPYAKHGDVRRATRKARLRFWKRPSAKS